MRVKVEFSSQSPVMVSRGHSRAIQGLIYSLLDDEYSRFLHDTGYRLGNRSFKFFTFSGLIGRYECKGQYLIFDKDVTLLISSPMERFISGICNNLLARGLVQLEGNSLKVDSISFIAEPKLDTSAVVRALTPITVYTTLLTADGRKKTYYYSPYETEFSKYLCENLRKKFRIMMKQEPKGDVELTSLGRTHEVVSVFKGTVIKGWKGIFKLEGDPELIRLGYQAGLGSKNSAGFGLIEVINDARLD